MATPSQRAAESSVLEGLVEIDGVGHYAVPDIDRMPPFMMSVVSDGDRWMFISSTGALTAGRVDSSGALFPYETEDRLHKAAGLVGPVSMLRVGETVSEEPWRPFYGQCHPAISRRLYKSIVGDSIIFEENHTGLQLSFRYRWSGSERYGFLRTATLTNHSDQTVDVEVVDGLLNILPDGLDPDLYQSMSNLTNAYKRSELVDGDHRVAAYSLESLVSDRPEPAESLRASVVWSIGLDGAAITLNPDILTDLSCGDPPKHAHLVTGRPGAYLLHAGIQLEPGEQTTWHIVADVGQDQASLADLLKRLRESDGIGDDVQSAARASTRALERMMAPADSQQKTGDRVATAHQFSNVIYNVMRGGTPLSGYRVTMTDFTRFVGSRNRTVFERHQAWLRSLPQTVDRHALLDQIAGLGDPQLIRLGLEYLPFGFSRRHGDPTRPWNAFSIRVRDDYGRPVTYYEGNWRDIFQNWEALCLSFPEYLTSVISVFVNASTADGFNPYRITREGIDWEVPDPDDPWSNIGYWGDHQIVYLLRLLEAAHRYLPGEVERLLGQKLFSFARVPYRISDYEDLVADPKSTITFDGAADRRAADLVRRIGSDGKLLLSDEGDPYLTTLLEKLLVPALAKLSNFVPDGGIWLNTQRPEWNDANNALVGYGLSMVTLYQLRRYLDYVRSLLTSTGISQTELSTEVADWLTEVKGAFRSRPARCETDRDRKAILDILGGSFSRYRNRVYEGGFSRVEIVDVQAIVDLCDAAIAHLDETINANRRSDSLFHSYNLVRFSEDHSEAAIEHLPEMLEGQVAVLSSGVLSFEERIKLIEALFASSLYREDQKSFILYPARRPAPFLEKNIIPATAIEANPLVAALLGDDDQPLISRDVDGRVRFDADLTNRDDLESALDQLLEVPGYGDLVAAHRLETQALYESVFRHHAYTGRSGSMYGYEGLGSIYWHMVAKLLVAVQESLLEAAGQGSGTVDRLADAYWRVRAGLGFNKSAAEFGAIPIDPYSHTPSHAGAQQPGMTGLVKEELLTRPLEVGIRVEDGEIVFDSLLLRTEELLAEPEKWTYLNVDLEADHVDVGAGALGATVCQVPVVVTPGAAEPSVTVRFTDGEAKTYQAFRLDRETTSAVFSRSGQIHSIHVNLPAI